MNRLIARAYELVTGTPYTTTRSVVAEFGPTLATRYPELADYTDAELYARPTAEILAEIRAGRAANRPKELTR
ncbi:hypothetical protein GCM10010169_23530 [Micromonospora fulviviridis]|uniref:hypothetical protein n=1 Tax=Micromonospora fulviviridis TaxID=47860 RepID=UPI00166A7F40|nr:hypothetical protein [Micromonospora fulviviridis]GGR78641.1 hypothetical protein GCM10010169_23530 [Micromonospora fulviviridis]